MNILFVIGNGFDLNLEMKTSYKDFYEYYQSINSKTDSVKKLKKDISNNYKNWSDLEMALGKYTEKTDSPEEFESLFENIGDSLADYLEKVEKQFDFEKLDGAKLHNYFTYPERYLLTADKNRLQNFKSKWNNSKWTVNVITFNYTQSLEKLLSYSGKSISISKDTNRPVDLTKIEHIHGYINDRMVMGVNDISQINNSNYHKERDIIEALVKSECNRIQKHTIDDFCKKLISQSNLICIFGSSLGDTDRLWWELIGKQLKKDCMLVIFEKGEIISKRRSYKNGKVARKITDDFLSKLKLTESEKKSLANKIFVGHNTDMFKI